MYQFIWVGKNVVCVEVVKFIDKILCLVVEDFMDWDNIKNIYIEGDNFEVFKFL